ncbi:MAG: hypothetical protein WCJ35_06535 [Planctomycetota bacterium]
MNLKRLWTEHESTYLKWFWRDPPETKARAFWTKPEPTNQQTSPPRRPSPSRPDAVFYT